MTTTLGLGSLGFGLISKHSKERKIQKVLQFFIKRKGDKERILSLLKDKSDFINKNKKKMDYVTILIDRAKRELTSGLDRVIMRTF